MVEDKKEDKKEDSRKEEIKKAVTSALEEAKRSVFSWDIKNHISPFPQSLSPRVTILLEGGDPVGLRKLGIVLEKHILDYAESLEIG